MFSKRLIALLSPLLAILVLAGCASMATQRLAGNIASAMLNQDDPDIVMTGAPAYLLLLDGMIDDNPDDTDLLMAGAKLYGAYASGLEQDLNAKNASPENPETTPARRFAKRSPRYAIQSLPPSSSTQSRLPG